MLTSALKTKLFHPAPSFVDLFDAFFFTSLYKNIIYIIIYIYICMCINSNIKKNSS